MFANHQPKIAAYAQQNASCMSEVALLCILSARMRFPRIRGDFRAVIGGDDHPLFAWKLQAWEEMQANREVRYDKLMSILRRERELTGRRLFMADVMLAEVQTWYGLGLIKGGFFLQMCFGVSGCVDSRNQEDFALSAMEARRWKAKPKHLSDASRMRHSQAYNEFINYLGGTEQLWDFWCAGYHKQDPLTFKSPWDASAEHCRILGINPGEEIDDEIPF